MTILPNHNVVFDRARAHFRLPSNAAKMLRRRFSEAPGEGAVIFMEGSRLSHARGWCDWLLTESRCALGCHTAEVTKCDLEVKQ